MLCIKNKHGIAIFVVFANTNAMHNPPQIGYFQHVFPTTVQSQLLSYKNSHLLTYQGSCIDFSNKDIFKVAATRNLIVQCKDFSIGAHDLQLSADKEITITLAGPLQLTAAHVDVQQQNAQMVIDDNGVQFIADKIKLCTPEVSTSTEVACEGDLQQCPETNGPGNPHVGGAVLSGSENAFINGKKIARHGDAALCQGGETQLISQLTSITINGKAIAYRLANTQHQGSVMTGSQLVILQPTCMSGRKSDASVPVLPINTLEISLANEQSANICVNTSDGDFAISVYHGSGTASPLTLNALKGKLQISITAISR